MFQSDFFKKLTAHPLMRLGSDLRFWILLFFLFCLPGITFEPIDDHAWRQCLTTTVTKNLIEIDPNPLYPRIDIAGNRSGIIAGEAPLYNYPSVLLSKLFGYQSWYGKLTGLIAFCFGLWFFSRIVQRLSGERTAFYSTIFLAFSIGYAYARKTMPDTFSVSLVLAGVHVAWSYLEQPKNSRLFLAFLLVAIGLLSKMPAFCVLTILSVPLLDPQYPLQRKITLCAALFFSGLLMLGWYFAWVPYLLKTYDYQLYWPVPLKEGLETFHRLHQEAWDKLEVKALGTRYHYILSVMGLGMLFLHKSYKTLGIFALWGAIFLVFAWKTGHVFPTHDYYVLPFAPVLAWAAGYGLAQLEIPALLRVFILVLLCKLSINRQDGVDRQVREKNAYLLRLPAIMDAHTPKNEKIIVNSGQLNPVQMYFAGRKGWAEKMENISKPDWMADWKRIGVAYILLDKHLEFNPLPYETVYEDGDFVLYKP
jgi:uncharacterized membrane protein YqjE